MTKAIALALAIIVFVVAGLHIPPGGAWSANYVYQFGAAIVILRILGPRPLVLTWVKVRENWR